MNLQQSISGGIMLYYWVPNSLSPKCRQASTSADV